jgi:hypothetical protein
LNFTDPSGFTRTKIGEPDLGSLLGGGGGGLGGEPPPMVNQVNQSTATEMVDLTGSFMMSGSTVGISPSDGVGAGPGSMGTSDMGPLDDGPPGSGSLVAGTRFPGNNLIGMGPENTLQAEQQLAADLAAAAARASETLEAGAAAASRILGRGALFAVSKTLFIIDMVLNYDGKADGQANAQPPAREAEVHPGKGDKAGKPMSVPDAIESAKNGTDILARDKSTAQDIARQAGSGEPEWDPPHHDGERPHYHPRLPNGERSPVHVMY